MPTTQYSTALFLFTVLVISVGCRMADKNVLSAETATQANRPTKEAVAVVQELRDRCVDFGKEVFRLSGAGLKGAEYMARRRQRENYRVANNAEIFEWRLIAEEVLKTERQDITAANYQALLALYKQTRTVCTEATRGAPRKTSLERRLAELLVLENRAPPEFSLSETERDQLLTFHRIRVEEAGRGARGTSDVHREASRLLGDESDDDAPPEEISADKFEARQKIYEKHLEERERQKRLRQETMQALRESNGGERELPRLKVLPKASRSRTDPGAEIKHWHRTYAYKSGAVKRALSRYLMLKRNDWSDARTLACRTLANESEKLLKDPAALRAPRRDLERHLRSAYGHFVKVGDACLQQKRVMVSEEIGQAEKSLGAAAQILKPFGLIP